MSRRKRETEYVRREVYVAFVADKGVLLSEDGRTGNWFAISQLRLDGEPADRDELRNAKDDGETVAIEIPEWMEREADWSEELERPIV